MNIQPEVAEALTRISQASEIKLVPVKSRYTRIRELVSIARTWHTKPFKCNGEIDPCFVIAPEHVKAFRRAFTEVMLEPLPIACIEHVDGSVELHCRTTTFARVVSSKLDNRGRVVTDDPRYSPYPQVSLSPKAICNLADVAETSRVDRIKERFAELSGGQRINFIGKVFWATQRRTLMRMTKSAVMKFSARLDPEALRISRQLVLNEPGLVGKLAHQDDTIALRWQQAMRAYPALVLDAWRHRESTAVEEAIEEGRPLVPLLAALHRTTEAVIRRYQGVLPQTVGRTLDQQRGYFDKLAFIGELPAHLRPKRQKEHMAVSKLIVDAGVFAQGQLSLLTRGMKDSLAKEKRLLDLVGFRDVRLSFYRSMSPLAVNVYDIPSPLDGLSLGARVRLNVKWHRMVREASMEASKLDAANSRTWDPLLVAPVELGGLVAVELCTSTDLVTEGLVMRHCVGGYTHNCVAGHSRIISLRTHAGDSVATLEIGRNERGGYKLRQNYTFGNQPAPAHANLAASKLLKLLRRPTVAYQGPWKAAGFDVYDRSGIEKAVDDAMQAFWHVMYPGIIPSLEERSALMERQAEERRQAHEARLRDPTFIAQRELNRQETNWLMDEFDDLAF